MARSLAYKIRRRRELIARVANKASKQLPAPRQCHAQRLPAVAVAAGDMRAVAVAAPAVVEAVGMVEAESVKCLFR